MTVPRRCAQMRRALLTDAQPRESTHKKAQQRSPHTERDERNLMAMA